MNDTILESERGATPPVSLPTGTAVRLRFSLYPTRITYLLIALNVLVFIPTVLWRDTVYIFGGLIPLSVFQYGQWWRVLTAGFIHGDITHIAFNMYALYSFGRAAERFFGPMRFLMIYLLALLGGSVTVTLLAAGDSLTIGASGAILGLLGALAAYFWRYQQQLAGAKEQLKSLAITAAVNLGIGLLPHVSLWGHLGGIVAGFMLGWALVPVYKIVYTPPPHFEITPLGQRKFLTSVLVVAGWLLLLGATVWLRG
ncbi:MAG: rhomboid family intramembrane serine protease [Chloroflexota bacterium]|nr:rhomboid family intramembrane serine protease [Chloroflexota bacterium]